MAQSQAKAQRAGWMGTLANYFELCKPKVVFLILITVYVGMGLASSGFVPFKPLFFGMLGIALCASGAAAINHLVDRHLDKRMQRTCKRPVATGKISTIKAGAFAMILCALGMTLLCLYVNQLTALLTFYTLIGYALIYSLFLKRSTSQNIVIGGLSGAMPPLLGWTAITGSIAAFPLLLVLIIFLWTPPHFWALAIYRREDYAKAGLPMLPVTHGVRHTKINIGVYTVLLLIASLVPVACGYCGWVYAIGATLLGLRFCQYAFRLLRTDSDRLAFQTFKFSILYLLLLFVLLLIDHIFLVL